MHHHQVIVLGFSILVIKLHKEFSKLCTVNNLESACIHLQIHVLSSPE